MLDTTSPETIRAEACPTCYLCGSSGEFLYQNLRDRIFNAPGEWNLKQRSNPKCRLVWLDPMPHPLDIGKAYETYFTHDNSTQKKKSILWYLLRTVYRAIRLTSSYLLGTRTEEIQLENMYLPQKPGRLLEVGFGSGKFLNRMQQAGWEVEGIDFDPKAAEAVASKYKIKLMQEH